MCVCVCAQWMLKIVEGCAKKYGTTTWLFSLSPTNRCVRVRVCVYVCVCACACVCVYVYVYMYYKCAHPTKSTKSALVASPDSISACAPSTYKSYGNGQIYVCLYMCVCVYMYIHIHVNLH